MASREKAGIEEQLGVGVELLRGSGGAFEVVVDGATVFSKHRLHRFPEPGELVALIRAASGA